MKKLLILILLVFIGAGLFSIGSLNKIQPEKPQFATNQTQTEQAEVSSDELMASREAYASGVRSVNAHDYEAAIQFFGQVIPQDSNYQDAQIQMDKAQKALMSQNQQQEKKEQAAVTPKVFNKANMSAFEGAGDVVVAVNKVQRKNGSKPDFNYLYVMVTIKNNGTELVRIIPNNFTLATPDKISTSIDYSTYQMNNYFKPVDLKPGQTATGWLTYYITKANTYEFKYTGTYDSVTKSIAQKLDMSLLLGSAY